MRSVRLKDNDGDRATPWAIEDTGARVLAMDCGEDAIDLRALMQELGKMKITSLLIEGGGHVNGSALRAGIVDKVCMFFAPKIVGGDDGVPVCCGSGPALMSDSLTMKNIRVRRFAEDVMIEGYLRQI